VREHIDLAGDIKIVRTDRETGFEHRCAGRREGSGAMQHHPHAIDAEAHRRCVRQIKHAMLKIEILRELADGIAASGEHRRQAAAFGFLGDELAGVTVRAVDHPVHCEFPIKPALRRRLRAIQFSTHRMWEVHTGARSDCSPSLASAGEGKGGVD